MKLSIGETDFIAEPFIFKVRGIWSKKVRRNLSSMDVPLKTIPGRSGQALYDII